MPAPSTADGFTTTPLVIIRAQLFDAKPISKAVVNNNAFADAGAISYTRD